MNTFKDGFAHYVTQCTHQVLLIVWIAQKNNVAQSIFHPVSVFMPDLFKGNVLIVSIILTQKPHDKI